MIFRGIGREIGVSLFMKISLNIRGLGGTIKKNYLRDLISWEEADMVCLQETEFGFQEGEALFGV